MSLPVGSECYGGFRSSSISRDAPIANCAELLEQKQEGTGFNNGTLLRGETIEGKIMATIRASNPEIKALSVSGKEML